MIDTADDWTAAIVDTLVEKGYTSAPSPTGRGRHLTCRGHSLGPFLPYTDYIFVHECSADTSSAELARLHEEARAIADSYFRLPRVLRYRIPNTVTVGVSEDGYSADAIAFAETSTLRSPLIGGEKDSKYLFDVANRALYSQGLEATPGRYGSSNVLMTNPTNRTYKMMIGVLERLTSA